jgi:acylphosphatase
MKKHIVITGKVQGIGFRYWLYKAAIQRNIDGWVRNKISGEVEALIIGNDENVNDLIKLCEKGPTFSKVTKVKVQNYQKEYSKKSFDIINNSN